MSCLRTHHCQAPRSQSTFSFFFTLYFILKRDLILSIAHITVYSPRQKQANKFGNFGEYNEY